MAVKGSTKSKSATRAQVSAETHPDHAENILRLRRVRGQLDGIEKMITDRRYCPDIMNQLRAASSAIKSIETQVMSRHLRHCVAHAIQSRDPKASEAKITEILALFERN
jgi:DNA-binding FrmR family transcriptional regulator